MYELIILSRLMRGPAHGYLIAKIINNVIGPFAKLSNGRFYPLLAKLEKTGLIAAAPYGEGEQPHAGERNARRYAITDTGRERFCQLMRDTTVAPGDHQRVFWFKVASLDLLEPVSRREVLDAYLHYCEAHVRHTRVESHDLNHCDKTDTPLSAPERTAILEIVDHVNQLWRLEADWVRGMRDRLDV